MEIKLILPTKKYKEKIELYKQGFLNASSEMIGCGSLEHDDVDTWLKKCIDYKKGKNLPDGFVPVTQYICVRKNDDKIIGMLQIRHYLSEYLLNFGGHIGNSIAVDERNKGYSKTMLALGIKKCKSMGINKILITCKDTNTASKKSILANGGIYENSKKLNTNKTVEIY